MQLFVRATEVADLNKLKVFLSNNGFENTKNNDYKNELIGVILEDLHDENVLSVNEHLFIVDSVFYLTSNKWFNENVYNLTYSD